MDEHRIGVISDTHGVLRPEAVEALKGSELIIHAGDVGRQDVLEELMALAPLVAVRGNVDRGELAARLPATQARKVGNVWIYVIHDLGDLDLDPKSGGFGVVISGHTHHPKVERRDGVLYLNPGSAGPRRFDLPVTLARLTIRDGAAEAELVKLPV